MRDGEEQCIEGDLNGADMIELLDCNVDGGEGMHRYGIYKGSC